MNSNGPSQQQFAGNAAKYRDDPLFAMGDDLRYMVQSVSMRGTEQLLDIGSGAGHVALAFAPFVDACLGIDVTEPMIRTASEYAMNRGIANVRFQMGDAANLALADASFDIVTSRFSAHHLPDPDTAIQEITRVLKPGGTFVLVDHYAPEDTELDNFVNQLNRLRDPSHVRESSLSEWQALFKKHGLAYRQVQTWDLRLQFQSWIDRAGTPVHIRPQIEEYLRTASPQCKDTFQIMVNGEGSPESFCLTAVLLQGTHVMAESAAKSNEGLGEGFVV